MTVEDLRKTVRVSVGPIHQITFRVKDGNDYHDGVLLNISYGGLGFRSFKVLEVGMTIDAVLGINDNLFEVSLIVEHVRPTMIGTSFATYSPALIIELGKYFNAEIHGLSLIEVNENLLRHTDEGKSHFFRAQNCEIFYVENSNRLIRFEITFYGNYIEGEPGFPARFGYLDEAPVATGMHHKGSTLIQTSDASDSETIQEIHRFVINSDKIPEILRVQIAEIIEAAI